MSGIYRQISIRLIIMILGIASCLFGDSLQDYTVKFCDLFFLLTVNAQKLDRS